MGLLGLLGGSGARARGRGIFLVSPERQADARVAGGVADGETEAFEMALDAGVPGVARVFGRQGVQIERGDGAATAGDVEVDGEDVRRAVAGAQGGEDVCGGGGGFLGGDGCAADGA